MNRKRFFFILLIATLAAGALAAEGTAERNTDVPFGPRSQGRYGMTGMEFAEESIEVSGKLSFEAWGHPVLTDGGKTYHLMVPRWGMYDLDIEEGQEVLVEGYMVTEMPWGDEETYLRVSRAVIDGKEYDLDESFDRSRMSMMSGRSRHYDPRDDVDQRRSPRGRRW